MDLTCGRLPHTHRLAVSLQTFRARPGVEALPPVEELVLRSAESQRYIRQEDPLWGRLHEGVLTTGLLRAALGLHEKSAAKRMGIPSSRSGHGELLHAYNHLRQQPAASGLVTALEAADESHNAAAVLAFNAAKQLRTQNVAQDASSVNFEAADAAPGAEVAPADLPQGLSRHARRRRRQHAAKAAAAAPLSGEATVRAQGLVSCCSGLSEEEKVKKARALGNLGLLSISCSWGKVQEAASLLHVSALFPHSRLAEVGLCRLQQHMLPESWGFLPGSLPPIGASPDALIRHGQGSALGSQAILAALPAAPANGAILTSHQASQCQSAEYVSSLLAQLGLAGTAAAAGNGSNGSSSCGVAAGQSIEVVEVKNTSPFAHSRRGGRLRTNEYMVSDRGPRTAVLPEWVPQLQLHMLCAGTLSSLLISRSATKGCRVFRMQRDDELLRLMLLVISRLWQQHVLPGRPPPPDLYASWREHHDMIRRIREAANGAALVAVTEDAQPVPGGDARWFLD